MSSERPRGRAATPQQALETAIRVAERACTRVSDDSLETYLANTERQDSIERLLLRFGEALKSVPPDILSAADPGIEWDKPIRFRDLAAHWYDDGLDHHLIWNVLKIELPILIPILKRQLEVLQGEADAD